MSLLDIEEQNLKNLFAQTPEMFCILKGPEHLFTYVNEAHIKALGFDATGLKVRVAQPESVEVHGILDDVYKTGRTAHLREIPVTVGDRLRYFDLTYAAKRDRSGTVDGILILGSEITESVLSKQKVEFERKRLYHFFEQVPAGMAVLVGEDLMFELANPAYKKLVGGSLNLLGKPLVEAVSGVPEELVKILKSMLVTGERFIALDYPVERDWTDTGRVELRYLNLIYEPMKTVDGIIEGIIVFTYDVTNSVLLRTAVEQSKEELRILSETLPLIIWTARPDGELDYTNSRWSQFSGSTVPSEWDHYIHPEDYDRVMSVWNASVKSGADYDCEFRLRRKDGDYIWFLVRAVALRNESGDIVKWHGTCMDIQEQKDLLTELEREREAREQFVSLLTHDLRNPLSAAKISAQSIPRFANDIDRVNALSTRITESLNRANRMIENLLDYNRIKAGQVLELKLQTFDLLKLAHEIVTDFATVQGDRFRVESNRPTVDGTWDPEGLRRIIENLCTNALKYGDETTPVKVSISVSDQVELSVHNFGDPIPLEDQKNLFNPHQRTKQKKTLKVTGWGLGLALVKGVAEAHGGSVSVRSQSNEGTTFTVILPIDASKVKK